LKKKKKGGNLEKKKKIRKWKKKKNFAGGGYLGNWNWGNVGFPMEVGRKTVGRQQKGGENKFEKKRAKIFPSGNLKKPRKDLRCKEGGVFAKMLGVRQGIHPEKHELGPVTKQRGGSSSPPGGKKEGEKKSPWRRPRTCFKEEKHPQTLCVVRKGGVAMGVKKSVMTCSHGNRQSQESPAWKKGEDLQLKMGGRAVKGGGEGGKKVILREPGGGELGRKKNIAQGFFFLRGGGGGVFLVESPRKTEGERKRNKGL